MFHYTYVVGKCCTCCCEDTSKQDALKNKKKGKVDRERNVKKMRFLERYFHKRHSPFVEKFKFVILGIWLILFIGFGVLASFIEPTDEPAQFLPEDTNFGIFNDLSDGKFFADGEAFECMSPPPSHTLSAFLFAHV